MKAEIRVEKTEFDNAVIMANDTKDKISKKVKDLVNKREKAVCEYENNIEIEKDT